MFVMSETCIKLYVVYIGIKGGERSSARLAAVHMVTEEEASSSTYSIEDVVMPLPGSQVQYPGYPPSSESQEVRLRADTCSDTVGESQYL